MAMKLKELKKSSLYQSSDLDDMEIMICISRNGKKQYEPLCFLGWQPTTPDSPVQPFVVVGGMSEVQRMVEAGEMEQPPGYVPPEKTKGLFDDSE